MNKKFKFEVSASKDIIVDGFKDVVRAREWLINNLNEECYDIVNSSSFVSNGDEVE